jgi:hypothetical protein
VTHNTKSDEEYDLLYAPYESLFSWSLNQSSGLAGITIFVDGEIQAVGLWDISNVYRKTANLYVDFCNVQITGLSEFLMVECCKTIRDSGIQFVNLGGSESKGLDTFKKKFHPVISIDLCSIEIQIDETVTKLENAVYVSA